MCQSQADDRYALLLLCCCCESGAENQMYTAKYSVISTKLLLLVLAFVL
jgi:hypothetical protein